MERKQGVCNIVGGSFDASKNNAHKAFLTSNIGVAPREKGVSCEVEEGFLKLIAKKISLLRVCEIMDEALSNGALSSLYSKEISTDFIVEVSPYDGANEYRLTLILFGVKVMSFIGDADLLILQSDLNFFGSENSKIVKELFDTCYDELLQSFMENASVDSLDDVDFGAFEAEILEILKRNDN